MKKIAQIISIILIIILILFIINFTRNYIIIKRINSTGNNFFNSSNYHITSLITDYDTESNMHTVKNEIYHKDNFYRINTYNDDVLITIDWKNTSTNESISYYSSNLNNKDLDIFETTSFNNDLIDSLISTAKIYEKAIIKTALFSIISIKDSCYVIKEKYITNYFSKDNYLPHKKETNALDFKFTQKYKFELNTVTDEQVKKPEI